MSDGTHIQWTDAPRITDPRGYVLIRLASHTRADMRGYVYEHVLVAEQSLGRPLSRGERVRHIDNNPGNNRPDNLDVRVPLDRKSTIACACGCGTRMTALDQSGRKRSYVSGHNPAPSPGRDGVLKALSASPATCLTPLEVAVVTGISRRAAAVALSKLARTKAVERPRVGYYRLPGSAAAFPPPLRKRPKYELGAGLSADTKEFLTEDFGGLCAYGCGSPAAAWDHLIPWSSGGSFRWPGNAVPACDRCNQSKNDSAPGPWVTRAFAADYSRVAMEQVITLAVVAGMADPDDFLDPAWDVCPMVGVA